VETSEMKRGSSLSVVYCNKMKYKWLLKDRWITTLLEAFFIRCVDLFRWLILQELGILIRFRFSSQKGNIAEALLKEGFMCCDDRTIVTVVNGAAKLRAAEKCAKDKRLRVCKISWTKIRCVVAAQNFLLCVAHWEKKFSMIIPYTKETKRS
jgi:hypothetical protein